MNAAAGPTPDLRNIHRTRAYHALRNAWREYTALACSGGIDSTALLLLAARSRQQGRVGPFIVVHVDHRERPDSADDARFVEALCAALQVPFQLLPFQERLPTVAGESREAQLRDERYRLIAEASDRLTFHEVATAHTLDDQAETILMRLISGSGTLGSAGMQPRTTLDTQGGQVQIVRPLLGVGRAELEEVLAVAGVEARADPSNSDPAYRRNALRSSVIPGLRAIEPGFAAALARSVEIARQDGLVVDAVAEESFDRLVQCGEGDCTVARDVVRSGDAAIIRRILRRAVLQLSEVEGRELTFERIEAVRLAAAHRSGALIELPGGVAAAIEPTLVRIMRVRRAVEGGDDDG